MKHAYIINLHFQSHVGINFQHKIMATKTECFISFSRPSKLRILWSSFSTIQGEGARKNGKPTSPPSPKSKPTHAHVPSTSTHAQGPRENSVVVL